MKNMKKLTRRGLSVFLALAMCLSMVQISAFAAEGDESVIAGGQITVTATEAPAPNYAVQADLDAVFEKVGAVLEEGDVEGGIAALDQYIAVYHSLSPEAQEANAEALEAALAYQETLKAAKEAGEKGGEFENPDIDTLAYVTYKSTITFYPGDGAPTGVNMKVGDHYKGNWYVKSISTEEVTFGSQYGEHNNNFTIPAPGDIWKGVSHNYKTVAAYSTAFNGEKPIGASAQLIYTGGHATFKNVINTPSSNPDPNPNPSPVPSGPYVTVVHEYYTDGNYDGSYREYQGVTAPTYDVPKTIYQSDIKTRKDTYESNTYTYISMSSVPSPVKVAKGATGNQGTFTLRYERTVQVAQNYAYRLTWDYNGGTVDSDTSRIKTETTQNSTHTFYEDALGYGSPKPTRDGFTFEGWDYTGNGKFIVSNGQIVMDGVANSTVAGTLKARWKENAVVPPSEPEKNPNLSITKAADKTSVEVGETVKYIITVENTGDATATDVKIVDVLNAEYLEWQGAGYSWTAPHVPGPDDDPDMIYSNEAGTKGYSAMPADGEYEISHEMRPGAKLTLTITAKAIKAGTVENTAAVTNGNTPDAPGDKVDVTVTEPAKPTYTYTLTYHANTGGRDEEVADMPDSVEEANITAASHKFIVSSTKPTWDGYVFTGWNTEEDGKGTAYVAGAEITATTENRDLHLYARWEKQSEHTVTVKYVDESGTEIMSSVTVDTTNGGKYDVTDKKAEINSYTFKEVQDEKALEGITNEDMEIVLVYTKNKENPDPDEPEKKDTTYTVVHEYYTNGTKDGERKDTVKDVKVGDVIKVEEITKELIYGDKEYTYTSTDPETELTLSESGNTIILRYDRTVQEPDPVSPSYTVTHEYYTNGKKDGGTDNTITGVKVGELVKAEDIEKTLTYQGNKYTYTSAKPERLTIAESGNRIVLRYDRTVTEKPEEKEIQYRVAYYWNRNAEDTGRFMTTDPETITIATDSNAKRDSLMDLADQRQLFNVTDEEPERDGYQFEGWTLVRAGNPEEAEQKGIETEMVGSPVSWRVGDDLKAVREVRDYFYELSFYALWSKAPENPDTPMPEPGTDTPVTPTPKPGTDTPVTPTPKPGTDTPVTPTPKPGTDTPVTPTPKPGTDTSDTPTPDPITPERPVRPSGGSGGSGGGGGRGGDSGNGPGVSSETVAIETDPVPLSNMPDMPADELITQIDDGNVPLAGLPKTGESSSLSRIMFVLSGMLLCVCGMLFKKEENG